MTYEQYWYGDVWLAEAFYKADRLRQERQNGEAWLQGMYVYNALRAALSVSDLFRGKGTKPAKYPDKPYEIFKKPKTEADKQKEIESERLRARAYFDGLIQANKARRGLTEGC